jgi:hypothetical protein
MTTPTRIHRCAAGLLVMLTSILLAAAPVGADSGSVLNREVTGAFAGTTFWDLSTPGCSLVHQTFDGTYTPQKNGTGTFHIDVCPVFGTDGGFVAEGTFMLRDRRGATLTGTVTGSYVTSAPPALPVEFVLEVDDGTRAFADVDGTILVTGVWDFVANPGLVSGTLAGHLTP